LTVVLVSAFALPDSAVAQKKTWRWGTADPSSFGYRVTLPTADKMLDIASPLQAVNPTPEQIEKLSAAGMSVVEIDIKKAFTRDVGVDKLYLASRIPSP
jgi:hypothetical protein